MILVSHDRYFIDKLATKIIDVGGGAARVYPGGYEDYRWSLAKREEEAAARRAASAEAAPPRRGDGGRARRRRTASSRRRPASAGRRRRPRPSPAAAKAGDGREDRKRLEAEERRRKRAREAVEGRIATLEASIAEREATMKTLEAAMCAPGFYEDHDTSKPTIDQHQTLMWELGDLMHRWEELAAGARSRPVADEARPGLDRLVLGLRTAVRSRHPPGPVAPCACTPGTRPTSPGLCSPSLPGLYRHCRTAYYNSVIRRQIRQWLRRSTAGK